MSSPQAFDIRTYKSDALNADHMLLAGCGLRRPPHEGSQSRRPCARSVFNLVGETVWNAVLQHVDKSYSCRRKADRIQ